MADPTPQETRQPSELLDADAYPQFLIRDRREIAHILRKLVEQRSLLTAYLNRQDFFLTTLLTEPDEEGRLVLDASTDAQVNARAAMASELVCVGRLDRVRIQFPLTGAQLIEHDGRPALRTGLPNGLLRLQRRESYRLATPVARPVMCTIPFNGEDGSISSVEARILDISNGGVAVLVPPNELALEPGMQFTGCRIALPDMAPIPVTLCVRNLFTVSQRNGSRALRAGCEFLDLPQSVTAQIQRYIFKVERDRNARERGF